jgi:hypothetical protein
MFNKRRFARTGHTHDRYEDIIRAKDSQSVEQFAQRETTYLMASAPKSWMAVSIRTTGCVKQ